MSEAFRSRRAHKTPLMPSSLDVFEPAGPAARLVRDLAGAGLDAVD
jgi:hypothetical protein